jgi:ElaB/YqjD/DUF883 family membrane-anchored ribosome-binding protein
MSDAATQITGALPPKLRKTARTTARKIKAEAESLVDVADDAREKFVAIAARRARARRAAVQAWARGRAEVAGETVQEHPVTAIAAAVAVGVIIGLLARR